MFGTLRWYLTGSYEPRGKFRKPRSWSNRELRLLGPHFEGSVINVSGKVDGDKEGGLYRTYFPSASEYYVSNYRNPDSSKEKGDRWDF